MLAPAAEVGGALLPAARELREAIDAAVVCALGGWGPAADEPLALIDRWLAEDMMTLADADEIIRLVATENAQRIYPLESTGTS